MRTARSLPRQFMHCLVLLLALSFLYGCGAVRQVNLPSSPSSSIVVTPATALIRAGETQVFAATASGPRPGLPGISGNPRLRSGANVVHPTAFGVTWSVNGIPGGNTTVGTIDSKGLYRAPATLPHPNSVRVAATSAVDPSVSTAAWVTLDNPIPMVASVSPNTVSVGSFTITIEGSKFVKGAEVLFAGTALRTTFNSATQLTAAGTATQTQLGHFQISVKNPDPGSTRSARAVDLQVSAPSSIQIAINPSNATVRAGSTQQFIATLQDTSNSSVTWSVNGVTGGNFKLGTISANGLYTAPVLPPYPSSLSVAATSMADSRSSGIAAISLENPIPVLISVSPSTVSVGNFAVNVSGSNFANGAVVVFGGKVLSTSFVSSTQLTATGTAVQQQLGPVQVAVQNPSPGPIMSAGLTVQVNSGTAITKSSTSGEIPSTFFGMTVSDKTSWPQVSVGALGKGTEVNWSYSEPAKGVFNWTNLDAWVKTASAHGVDFFFSNDRIPPWAAADPSTCVPTYPGSQFLGCTSMVADIQDWDDFVTALVTRYRGKIKVYELWNEPDDQETNFSGTVANMVTLTQHMYDRIRAIDPQAIIVAPGPSQTSAAATWLDHYFAAGGVRTIDVVSLHGYPHHYKDVPESIAEFTSATRSVMAKYGISDKPIWDTEGSWGCVTEAGIITDIDAQAAFIARHYLLHWSNGVTRFYWYSWDGETWGVLWSPVNGPNLAANAYQQVYNWMVGATMSKPCAMAPDSTWTCDLTRPGGYEAQVVWNALGTTTYVAPIQYNQSRDLTGVKVVIPTTKVVTIGSKPILLEK